MNKGFTIYTLFEQGKKKYPDAVLFIRNWGDCYECLNEDADKVHEIAHEALTHIDAGQCYVYQQGQKFTFGIHNLDKVLPLVIRAGHRTMIADFVEQRKEWEKKHPEYIEELQTNIEKILKPEPPRERQMSLFDIAGFFD